MDDKRDVKFEVPRIQRTYAWKKKQVDEFINDLKRIAATDNSEHYFGAFCTAEKDENTELIIDGQQRIATSHLFLKCAQNKIQNAVLKKQVNDIINNAKIVLGKSDQKIFDKIMREKFDKIMREPDFDKNSNLCKAYQNIDKNITNEMDIDKLVETLLLRFRFVKIKLKYKNFKRTFHLVNNRGIELTQSQLVKSHIFMDLETDDQFSAAKLDELDGQWAEMEKNIRSRIPSPIAIDQFIQHVLSLKHGPTSRESLFDELTENEYLKPSSKNWLLELFEWGAWYANLLKPSEEFAEPSAVRRLNVKSWLRRIREARAQSIYPILLSGYKKYFINNNKKDFHKLVDSCYRFHIRVKTLGNVNVTDYTRFTQELANKMYTDDLELNTVNNKLACYIREGVENNDLKTISKSIENIKSTAAKHCLLLIEEYKYGVEKIANKPTLEHVLPQNYTSPNWRSYINETYDSPEEPKHYVNKLGNMVLLSGNKNSEVRDKPLAEKVQVYKKSAYKITQELHRKKSWTQSDIDARCTEYAKSLEQILDVTKYLKPMK